MLRKKTTIRLTITFITALLLYWFTDNIERYFPPSPKDATKLLSHPMENVNKIVISSDNGKKFIFERIAEDWKITAPISASASREAMMQIIDTVETSTNIKYIEPHELKLRELKFADFGLGHPAGQIEFYGPGLSLQLKIGDYTPATNGVYVLLNSRDGVNVSSLRLRKLTEMPLEHFSDRNLTSVNPREVNIVEIERPGLPIVRLERKSKNAAWKTISPEPGVADFSAVKTFFETIQSAKIASFASEGSIGNARENPLLTIKLYTSADTFPRKITVLQKIASPENAYLCINENNNTVLVREELIDKIALTADNVRDKRVFISGPTLNVTELTLAQTNHPTMHLSRARTSTWLLREPLALEANQQNVAELLEKILTLHAEGHIQTLRLQKIISLQQENALPGPTITITTPDATNILHSTYLVDRNSKTNAFVSIQGSDISSAIPTEKLDQLKAAATSPHTYISLDPPMADPTDIHSLIFVKPDKTQKQYYRGLDGIWSATTNITAKAETAPVEITTLDLPASTNLLTISEETVDLALSEKEPEEAALDQTPFKNIEEALHTLRARKIISYARIPSPDSIADTSEDPYNFKNPRLTLILQRNLIKQHPLPGFIQFGNLTPDGKAIYARTDYFGWIITYELPIEHYDTINLDFDKLTLPKESPETNGEQND